MDTYQLAKLIMFSLVVLTGVICLVLFRKLYPESFWYYFLWVACMEAINVLILWPF